MSGTTADEAQATAPRGARRQSKAMPYDHAGPKRLSQTPARAPAKRRAANPLWQVLKAHAESRINLQRSWRWSWSAHWSLLETYLLPRRGIFINAAMPTPNSMIRGAVINQAIIDETGTIAMRRCAAGLMSNEMSPSRQWFKLKPALLSREEAPDDAVEWFEEVEGRMLTVMARSNIYQEAAQMFEDLVTFGTGPMIIYEDDQDLIRAYTPCCGEYFLSSSSANRAETLSRTFVMTVAAIVEMFGLENCPNDIQQLWQAKGGSLEIEKIVAHIIEPNAPLAAAGEDVTVPGGFAWREAYWVWGSSSEYPLSLGGFHEQPHLAPRWAVTSNDPYGRSPGMDMLGALIQLQVEQARKAEAIEKMVRPPMLASLDMKNEPASILPGKVTYVNGLGPDKGMRPAFTVNPQIDHMMQDLKEVQIRIREGFFNDLFAMLEQVGRQMTAYEVAARNQEKLQILGPVIERIQNEALAPIIKRVFEIMQRRRLLPPLPESLIGVPLGIEYVGVLALAQRASKSATLEQFANSMNAQAQIDPSILDMWDRDQWALEQADALFISQKIMRNPKEVAAIRQQRAQQQQAANAVQGAQAMANVGKTASEIELGGGINAMNLMTGLGSGGQLTGGA
jgi:hypothetical protein